MRSYLTRKNLFIIRDYPEIFSVEDSYIILGTENNIKNIKLDEIENIFTIFYLPVWIKSLMTQNFINVIYLNREGEPEEVLLHKAVNTPPNRESFLGLNILQTKAHFMANMFKISEAVEILNLSLKKNNNLHKANQYLNFLLKAEFIDIFCKKVGLKTRHSQTIIDVFFNFTENIVAFSLYNKFISQNINPEEGILNNGKVSLIKDLTEIMRLRFLKKFHHLIESKFFEKVDFDKENYLTTVVKFIKILSTYFFYSNRFKRLREISYIIQLYKRGKADEIFGGL